MTTRSLLTDARDKLSVALLRSTLDARRQNGFAHCITLKISTSVRNEPLCHSDSIVRVEFGLGI